MKLLSFLAIGCATMIAASCSAQPDMTTLSPDGRVAFNLDELADGSLCYTVTLSDSTVILPSHLGLSIGGNDIAKGAKLTGAETRQINDNYTLKAGKRLNVTDACNETVYSFKGADGRDFSITVRAYDDGVAFRYNIDGTPGASDTIDLELTEFAVPTPGKAWIHPFDWNERHKPSYEQYSKNNIDIYSPSEATRGWAYPMLFELPGKQWMMVSEAQLDGNYPATHVDNSGTNGSYRVRFPEADEPVIDDDPRPVVTYPFSSPWRVIMVGDDLNSIFANQIVDKVNPPCAVADTTWIKPGRCAWSWWYEGRTSMDHDAQIKYVDFCKEMGWEYNLVDAGWPRMDKGGIEDVIRHANENGVGIWLWYHSGSGVSDTMPAERRLMSDPVLRAQEMACISALGVKGIKVDFFDTDKQRIINLYPQILRDAAENHLMVNFHGATLPRGFERTYPNLMTTEAIRGGETLGRQDRADRAAEHNATVVFTRNVIGSMDYTPVTFSDKIRRGVPSERRTSVAHQLALAVAFESGLQCFADRAEAYQALPELPKQFLKDVPVAWDESVLLSGYPSDHAVIARRHGDNWYLGAINGTSEAKEVTFTMPEACKGQTFTLIKDGADEDTFDYEEVTVNPDGQLTVKMLPMGGFAAKI